MNWSDEGGGLYNIGFTSIMENCTFSYNSARYGGAACFGGDIIAKLTNCVFSDNSAGTGGAISNYTECDYSARSLKLLNCTFNNNESDYRGGGIYNYSSTTEITNCTFSRNSSLDGGGMYDYMNRSTLINCIFSQNSASESGGGFYNVGAEETILTNCIFTGNSAVWNGGCVYNDSSSSALANCTFAGNSAPNGNVLACDSYQHKYPSNVQITNCILWDEGDEIWNNDNSVIAITYSDVQGSWPGTDNIASDPFFVEPGYWDANGVWVEGDYHILAGSPCIDAGDPNYVSEPNETDLDGRPRVMGERIDIGAYETPMPAEVRIVPHTINLASKGNRLTCYIWLPEGYDVADIDPSSVVLEQYIKSEQVSVDEQKQVAIAMFSREELRGIISTGEVELTISGRLTDGTIFEATDVIKVIDKGVGKSVN
jgi:hypothetical protein